MIFHYELECIYQKVLKADFQKFVTARKTFQECMKSVDYERLSESCDL